MVVLAILVGAPAFFRRTAQSPIAAPPRLWTPADVLDRPPGQSDLSHLANEGFLIGMTLEEARRYVGGYRFAPNIRDGTYSAYIEHLGAPMGIFIVKVWTDREDRISAAIVKYD